MESLDHVVLYSAFAIASRFPDGCAHAAWQIIGVNMRPNFEYSHLVQCAIPTDADVEKLGSLSQLPECLNDGRHYRLLERMGLLHDQRPSVLEYGLEVFGVEDVFERERKLQRSEVVQRRRMLLEEHAVDARPLRAHPPQVSSARYYRSPSSVLATIAALEEAQDPMNSSRTKRCGHR